MGSRVLLGVPLVLASSGCAFSTRAGPEVMALPAGPALEARGTATFGLGSASGQSAARSVPASRSIWTTTRGSICRTVVPSVAATAAFGAAKPGSVGGAARSAR